MTDPRAISEKTLLAWETARECARAGLNYEQVRRIAAKEATPELCAEYVRHKARAQQRIADMKGRQ